MLNRTQLKAFARLAIKVLGGGPVDRTRGKNLLSLFDQYADAARLQEDLVQYLTLPQAQALLPSVDGEEPGGVVVGATYIISGFPNGYDVVVQGAEAGYFAGLGHAIDVYALAAVPVAVDVRAGTTAAFGGGEVDTSNLAKLDESNTFLRQFRIAQSDGLGPFVTFAQNGITLENNDDYLPQRLALFATGIQLDSYVGEPAFIGFRAGDPSALLLSAQQVKSTGAVIDPDDLVTKAYADGLLGKSGDGPGAPGGTTTFDFTNEIHILAGLDDPELLRYVSGRAYALDPNPDGGDYYGVQFDYGSTFADGDVLCLRNNHAGHSYEVTSPHSGNGDGGFFRPSGDLLVVKSGEAYVVKFCYPPGADISEAYWSVVASDKAAPVVDLSSYQEKTGYYSPIIGTATLSSTNVDSASYVRFLVYRNLFFKSDNRVRVQSPSGYQDGKVVFVNSPAGELGVRFDKDFANFQGPFTVSFAPYQGFTPISIRSDVANGTFYQGELTSFMPPDSVPGMKFSTGNGTKNYIYEYMLSSSDSNGTNFTWVRYLRG